MKKLFFLAMSALVLLACSERNAPDIPKKDQSVLSKASKNVIKHFGESKAEAEAAFIKAGFRKSEIDMYYVPERRVVKAPQRRSDDDDISCFVYNITEEMENDTEGEMINKIIESKKTALIFFATYINGIFANVQGKLIVGAEVDNVNMVYLDCSDNLHDNISGLTGTWQGQIVNNEDDDEVTEDFTSYKPFYNALYPMNALFAQEAGGGQIGGLFSMCSFGYSLTWNKPNETEARFQINNYGYKTPIAEAGFSISYTDPSMYNN